MRRGAPDYSGPRAFRSGALDIDNSPVNGRLNSSIRKIAHAADKANTERHVKTQNRQKRSWNQTVGFYKQQKASLREIIAELGRSRLQRTLQVILRR